MTMSCWPRVSYSRFEGYPVPSARQYCMDTLARWRDDARMPLDLTDAELATAFPVLRDIRTRT